MPPCLAGLENCRWPGRCQVVPLGPSLTLFLDGAHTVESVDFCLRWFREARRAQVPPGTRPWPVLLFNCMGDRRPELMLSQLAEHPFRTALFTTNRVADDKSPYSGERRTPRQETAGTVPRTRLRLAGLLHPKK